VLAVELFNRESEVIDTQLLYVPEPQEALPAASGKSGRASASGGGSAATAEAVATPAAATAQSVLINDPLGAGLGSQRILRVSPLTPVRAIC
jgi:hypothetical protein